MDKKYEWKLKALAKDIDPDEAVRELETIENIYGSLTAENVLDYAQSQQTKLHALFTWDDSAAAHQYRLSQARTILNNVQVTTVSDGEKRYISVYEVVVTDSGRCYKNVSDLTTDELQQVKVRTIKELNALKNKLSLYKTFVPVVAKVEETLETVQGL